MTETRLARRPSGDLGAWNPLAYDVDRFFGGGLLRPFFADWFDRFESMGPRTWIPTVDIRETDDAYLVTADLPGFNKDSVDVTLEGNVLTITGERSAEEDAGRRYHRLERSYGRFSRSFTLPATVQANKVKAQFKDGVLTLTVPKAAEARPHRIRVN